MHEPGLDQRIIALPGIDCRLLWTPAERLQPAGQRVGMRVDVKLHQHEGANPLQRPAIRFEAGLQGPLGEQLQQALPLSRAQSRWSA